MAEHVWQGEGGVSGKDSQVKTVLVNEVTGSRSEQQNLLNGKLIILTKIPIFQLNAFALARGLFLGFFQP